MTPRSLTVLALLLLAGPLAAQTSPVRLGDLTCEHQTNPVGIGETAPRLSWKLLSDRVGEAQTAYEIRAASSADALKAGNADLWSSGKVASDQSVLVSWGGKALTSRAHVFWEVRVWDKDGVVSAWSDPATFELGLLDPAKEWKGQWITVDLPRYDVDAAPLSKASWINAVPPAAVEPAANPPAAQGTAVTFGRGAGGAAIPPVAVRYVLDLPADAKIRGATIDAIGNGVVSLYANGQSTLQGSSSHSAPFHADFGQNLHPGKNIIALAGAPPRLGRGPGRNAIAAHGVVELDNGTHLEFDTDSSWKAGIPEVPAAARGRGPVTVSVPAWAKPDFDDSTWTAAQVVGKYSTEPLAGDGSSTVGAGRYLRKSFAVKGPVVKARLYSTALGIYEATINGQAVNDHQLDPGFTDYNKRVMYQVTDVTKLLKPGPNAIGALLNDGWFAGRIGWMGLAQFKQVSDHPSFNAQLEITYADGSTDTIATDNTWKGGAGEELGSDEQLGEALDARKASAWNQPAFDDSAWTAVTTEDHSKVPLVPQIGPPVRKLMELTPKKITHQGNVWLVDFGQNMVGHVRLTVRGPAGAVVQVTHGEMLNPDGTLFTENLRTAISLDTFTLKGGDAPETFEPHFTFHGFRYANVVGYPGELMADDIRGVVVGSDNANTGEWESSDKDLNQLYSNIRWSQRGNYLSVPTDCPQRDERLGWMGDAQVFAPTGAYNADVAGFFRKWMADVDDAQRNDDTPNAGAYATVAPRANQADAYPVWGDAGVIVPWAMYKAYGDKKFLEDNYSYMARWVIYEYNKGLIQSGGVGDHLAPAATPTEIIDTAYFANSAHILAESAKILGHTDDAVAYARIEKEIIAAFNENFVSADGTIQSNGGGAGGPAFGAGGLAGGARAPLQTPYIVALRFNLLPENLRAAAAQKLADAVTTAGHLTTGFPGSGLLNPELTQIGRSDLAWKLVFTDTYPSWLFPVKNGATTIWERWDAWTPDKGFQASSMNSFNHYSFGAVGYWFYSGAAGIQLDDASPGYKHFFLAPQFTDKLTYLKSSFETQYGKISSYWHVEGDQMNYDVTVPPNSSATLKLAVPANKVMQAGKPVKSDTDTSTSLALAAGTYHFSFPKAAIQ